MKTVRFQILKIIYIKKEKNQMTVDASINFYLVICYTMVCNKLLTFRVAESSSNRSSTVAVLCGNERLTKTHFGHVPTFPLLGKRQRSKETAHVCRHHIKT